LDERILADGTVARCFGSVEAGRFRIQDDGVDGALSFTALDRVMTRYARPLDESISLDGESLDLGDGRRLRRLRYRAAVDADSRDYLVWERPGEPPIAVIATMVTAALRYLVLRLAGEVVHGDPQESEG
jgi:hypothetical protein